MRQSCIPGTGSALVIGVAIWSYAASAQTCVTQAPRYALTSDTVDWSIQVASGQSCVRGLRLGNVVVEKVSLTTPPKSGNVRLEGPGFRVFTNALPTHLSSWSPRPISLISFMASIW